MSYCVNCGVELSKSEPKCPLCDTEVLNPHDPWQEPEKRPYPKKVERIQKRATRRFVLALASLLLLIPIIITAVCDLIYNGRITWSMYVVGAAFIAYIFVVIPLTMKKSHPILCMLLDVVAAGIYLFVIETQTGGAWLLPLALPLLLLFGAANLLIVLVIQKKRPLKLVRASFVFFTYGVLAVAIEFVVNRFTAHLPMFEWSIYVFVVCVILGIIALIVNKRREFKEEVRRRFFF